MKKMMNKGFIMLLTMFMLLQTSTLGVLANNADISTEICMPDLGIEKNYVSEEIASDIEARAIECQRIGHEISMLKKQRTLVESEDVVTMSQRRAVSELNREINTLESSYYSICEEIESMGGHIMTPEQAYLYASSLNETPSDIYSDELGELCGITFSIHYVTVSQVHEIATVIAMPTPNVPSKLVQIYDDPITFYDEMTFSDMANKVIKWAIGDGITNYAGMVLPGSEIAVSLIMSLTGDVIPTNAYSHEASLELEVTTSSIVIHHWKAVEGRYYLRLTTNMATIRELWTFKDVNGQMYVKQQEYDLMSDHYQRGMLYASTLNNCESYHVVHGYKVPTTIFGITTDKVIAVITPFYADQPTQFVYWGN